MKDFFKKSMEKRKNRKKEGKDGKNRREKISMKKKIREMTKKKSFRIGTYTAAATTVVLVIAVVINLCVGALPKKYTQLDMTSVDLYSISQQTEEVAADLDQEVTVYYIVQDGNEDAVIEQLLNHYQELSGQIQIEKVDPVESPTFVSQFTDEEVYNNSLLVVSGDKSRYISYYVTIVTTRLPAVIARILPSTAKAL